MWYLQHMAPLLWEWGPKCSRLSSLHRPCSTSPSLLTTDRVPPSPFKVARISQGSCSARRVCCCIGCLAAPRPSLSASSISQSQDSLTTPTPPRHHSQEFTPTVPRAKNDEQVWSSKSSAGIFCPGSLGGPGKIFLYMYYN